MAAQQEEILKQFKWQALSVGCKLLEKQKLNR
jgi:hypothetical protein